MWLLLSETLTIHNQNSILQLIVNPRMVSHDVTQDVRHARPGVCMRCVMRGCVMTQDVRHACVQVCRCAGRMTYATPALAYACASARAYPGEHMVKAKTLESSILGEKHAQKPVPFAQHKTVRVKY